MSEEKSFRFFKNMRDVIKTYPVERQLEVVFAIVDYGLDRKEPDTVELKALIQALKPSLDKEPKRGGAREHAGAPRGNDNAKQEKKATPAPAENRSADKIMDTFPNWLVDILTGKTPPFDECDCDVELQPLYRKLNPYINSFLTNPSADKVQLMRDMESVLLGLKPAKAPPPQYVKTGKKFELKFCKTIDEIDLCKEWIQYKKNRGEAYRDEKDVECFMDELRRMAGGNIEKMKAIVSYSRGNNYKGIIAPKSEKSAGSGRIESLMTGSEMAKEILKKRGEL